MRARSDNDTLANAILSGDAAPEPLAAWTLDELIRLPDLDCVRPALAVPDEATA